MRRLCKNDPNLTFVSFQNSGFRPDLCVKKWRFGGQEMALRRSQVAKKSCKRAGFDMLPQPSCCYSQPGNNMFPAGEHQERRWVSSSFPLGKSQRPVRKVPETRYHRSAHPVRCLFAYTRRMKARHYGLISEQRIVG